MRIGVLKHLADFIKVSSRECYLIILSSRPKSIKALHTSQPAEQYNNFNPNINHGPLTPRVFLQFYSLIENDNDDLIYICTEVGTSVYTKAGDFC